jgi:hypothetical protein
MMTSFERLSVSCGRSIFEQDRKHVRLIIAMISQDLAILFIK